MTKHVDGWIMKNVGCVLHSQYVRHLEAYSVRVHVRGSLTREYMYMYSVNLPGDQHILHLSFIIFLIDEV